jgi:hypothetical protein
MAIEETVVIKTDTKSLSALKTEIKEIQSQLDLTPTGTKEYDALVVKLRQAKGEIKDFKEATKGLDPDQRAAKLVNAFRGMTGAIQAAAGAITLFGGSGKELEEVEKNLLGIITIGGGVQSTIEGFNDAADVIGPKFTQLGNFIKSGFQAGATGAQTFKSALAALGIGAAIAIITALITNFDDLKQAVTGVNRSLSFTDEEIKNISTEVGKSVANVEILTNKVQDQNLAEKDRLAALKELQKLYPNYFNNIGTDINNTSALTTAKNKLNEALLREAKVRALQEKLAEVVAKDIEDEIKLNEQLAKQTDELAEFERKAKEAAAEGDANAFKVNIANKKINIAETKKELAEIQAERTKNTKVIIDLINKEELAIKSLGGATTITADKTVKATEKVLTASEKELITITNAIAAKQRLYDVDIENLKKKELKELEGAIDSAEKREGIKIKYDALEVERGKKLGNDLLQLVKDSEKRLVKADETVLIKRAEVQIQGNKIINQQNLESINAAIKQREDATKKSNEQIEENLRTALNNSERALEVEQSFFAQLIEEYKELTADNYLEIFDDQDVFYNDLVKRLEEYGIEVDRETAEQIRQKGLAIFKADEDAQLAQDQFYKEAIAQLRKNGEEGNKLADKLEQERKAKFDQNQSDKLASAVSFGQKEVDIAQNTANQIVEIQDQFYSSLSQFANDYASLQSTLVQNELDRELAALDKRTSARIEAAGDDAEAVSRIQKDSILLEDDLRRKAFENEKQRKLKLSFINEATAVLSILAETPKADFGIATALLIAGAIATARLQQQAIRDTQYIPSYAEGGLVTGPGTSTSDSILARLSSGEFVVNAKSTQRFLPVLNTLNNTPNNNQLSQTIDSSGSSPMFRTYVLAGDVTSAQAAEARLNQKRKL